jgi:DNA gyrase subunit A
MDSLERNQINIEDEMRRSYLDYAMSVIIGRALPDVRDGLKPVHRRILYGMFEQGNTAGKAYRKSARAVGDVMGKYHPHGDSAIYDSVVRMAQDFSMRYTLVDGQGNFGSVDGDNPAAMRYTEVRLAKIAGEVLADIEKETVNFVPNYDDSLTEPSVLPTKIPLLLANGSEGIAVGMATKIPPHNLGEIIDGTVALIKDPHITIESLSLIPGFGFPTASFIWRESDRPIRRPRVIRCAKAAIDEITAGERVTRSVPRYRIRSANELIVEWRTYPRAKARRVEVRDEPRRHAIVIELKTRRDSTGRTQQPTS